MDPELEKKIKRVEPTKAESKRLYDQPLRVLRRGLDRKMKGFPKRPYRSEPEELFFSIDWGEAWQQFLDRDSDGRFKYKTVFELSSALAIGINAQVRKHRAGHIYSAIGPVSASDKTKKVPYLGDWDMLRSQTFLGEMKKDSLLFGSPRMKIAREAMRKHVDVMETAKAMAETMVSWVARYEMWSRQVDEHFDYKVIDPKLSAKENAQRFAEYTGLQRALHTWQHEAVEHVLRCYGVGKDEASVFFQQMVIAAMAPRIGENMARSMMAGVTGAEVIDGKAAGGGVSEPTNGHSQGPYDQNPTLKLIMASFLEKAAVYRMPQPDVHIDGVPDEEEQESPREHIKRAVREMLPDSGRKRIQ
jgi:hypothetical protein